MPNEYEQPVEPMSRTEDLLRTGTEEPVIAMSEIEKILRGEHIDRPHSRVADLLLQYNPSDILIEKRIEENGTYYATADAADGYYKVVVDTPVIPPTVLEHLVETISTNGSHTFTPETGVDGFSDASITVDVAPNVGSKSITQNGNYAASSDNLDGYSNVNVNIAPNVGSKNITENGTYNASSDNLDGYSKAIVNVPPEPITESRTVENLPQPIASFNNGAEAPITSLKVAIEPQQDLHGYDSPWVGGAGANKWDEEWKIGDIDGNTGEVKTGQYLITKNLIQIEPSTAYYFYIPSLIYIFKYDENQNLLGFEAVDSSKAVTIPSDTHYIMFRNDVRNASQTYGNNIAINYPATVTTYSPYSNECPISGWDEVDIVNNSGNWWDEEYQIYGSGATARIGNKNPIPCKPNTTYYITKPPSNGWRFYDKDMNVLSTWYNQTYTTQSNCYYMSFQLHENYGTTYNNDVCISTISVDYYTPYTGTTYTIDLDGTRYGGEVDVVNNNLDVTNEIANLGDLTWTYVTDDPVTQVPYFVANIADRKPSINMMCTSYATINGGRNELRDMSVASYNLSNNSNICIADSTYNDATVFKTHLQNDNVTLVYELATPITIQLTPTQVKSLKGANNVYANTGNINDLDYIYVNDDVGTLINKSITANGLYCAVIDDNADGYLNIDVNLPDGTNTEY